MKIEEILRSLGYRLLADYARSETNKKTLDMLKRFANHIASTRKRFDLIN